MAIHSSSIRLARANLLPFASLTHGTQGTHLAHFFLLIYKTAGKRKKRLGKEEKMVSQSVSQVWCGVVRLEQSQFGKVVGTFLVLAERALTGRSRVPQHLSSAFDFFLLSFFFLSNPIF